MKNNPLSPGSSKIFWSVAKAVSEDFSYSSIPPLTREDKSIASTPKEKANILAKLVASNSTVDFQGSTPTTIFNCEDKPSLDTLKSCLTAPLAKKYSIDEPKKYNPRLIIMDARLEGLDSSEDIINSIALLNGLDDSRKSEIKVITKLKRFNMIDLVIEVTPALRNIFLQKEYVLLRAVDRDDGLEDASTVTVSESLEGIPIVR
nr:unnamed protein product [Callosobruchus analis]